MPGKAKEQTQSVDTPAGALDAHFAILEDRSGAYMVSYADYPTSLMRSEAADQILDGATKGSATGIGGELVSMIDFPLGSFPGREAEYTVPAQGSQPAMKIRAHYFLVKDRLYQVMVIIGQDQTFSETTQTFLNSFKLTND